MTSKAAQLRTLIQLGRMEFLMEAHNGLSARIVEQAGFRGIWASGLSISASLGVRDNNEASWTQVLEVAEFMSDATSIPILLDGDTGYGNFNNMRRLVTKLEQRQIAGVCIEDKCFPKSNSFLRGEVQPLADIDEFCGKIKAAKDCQRDPDFVVVARLEAFIAGWGLPEALRRAEAYRLAGADAILVHSKQSTPAEIAAFMKEWGGRHPVVIVPTKYYSTPTEEFRRLGVNLVIWANHNMRASIEAMQRTTAQIFREQSVAGVEDSVATVSEIFRLQGDAELEEAERRYLPTAGRRSNAIILAAAQGTRLGELTKDMPKALLKINGRPLLTNLVDEFNQAGIRDITVVRGFAKDRIQLPNARMVDNDHYATTRELWSLNLAREMITEGTVVSYGDIYFKRYVLHELLSDDGDITVVADAEFQGGDDYFDFIKTDVPFAKSAFYRPAHLLQMSTHLPTAEVSGEFIGLFKMNATGATAVKEALIALRERPDFAQLRLADLFNELVSRSRQTLVINVKFIKASWLDVDSVLALQRAVDLGMTV